MRFDQREWVTDMATGVIAGALTGLTSTIFVPHPFYFDAISAGTVLGLVPGIVAVPLKWLLNRRPGPPSPSKREDTES